MEFGIFHSGHVLNQPDPEAQRKEEHRRLMDEVAVAIAGDRNAFKYSWWTEHHFLQEYSHVSASEIIMSFAAGKTDSIHFGSGIWNLTPPVNPPARVAERVAMLDHVSEGRFEWGTGRGSSSTEYMGFGIPDGDTTRELFDETFPEILRMFRETKYSYDGPAFSMPERNVLPKPYTAPHPPLWIACGSPSTFEKAGRLGLGALCFALGAPDKLAPLVESYKAGIEQAEPIGDYINDNVACVSRVMCMEDGDRARELVTGMGSGYYQSLVFHYLDSIPKPEGVPVWPDLVSEPTLDEVKWQADKGIIVAGDPDECSAAVQKYADIGADQIIFGVLNNTLPVDVAVESMETFGGEVIPRFDKDPVHSTTRQRNAQLP